MFYIIKMFEISCIYRNILYKKTLFIRNNVLLANVLKNT